MTAIANGCRPHHRAMDAHFAARAKPGAAQALFAHLADCPHCRARYDRHLLLADLDPRAPSEEARLARSLGLGSAPRRRRQWMIAASMTLATACVLLVLLPLRDHGFAARGGHAPSSTLLVYRVHDHGAPSRLQLPARISRRDELSFAYSNPEKLARLMIFAVDDQGRVYWFHPAWTDANADPVAIDIAPTASVIELGEAVRHDFPGHSLTLYALFTNEQPTVRQVEALIAKNALNPPIGRVLRYRLDLD